MTNITYLFGDKEPAPQDPATNWWMRESRMLGLVGSVVLGAVSIVAGVYALSTIFSVSASFVAGSAIGLIAGAPLLVGGVTLMVASGRLTIKPIEAVGVAVVSLILSLLLYGQFWQSAIQADRYNATLRQRSIEVFVGHLGLSEAQRSPLIAKLLKTSDRDLCQAGILGGAHCDINRLHDSQAR